MKIPDKEFLEKNKVHLEMLDVNGTWKRINTFYDYATAVNYGVNKFFVTHTAHRLTNNEGRIVELFDSELLNEVSD